MGIDSPASHDIGVAAEDLGQRADDDVAKWSDFNVDKVTNGLIDDDQESVLIGKFSYPLHVGCSQKWIARHLAEEGEQFAFVSVWLRFLLLQQSLQIWDIIGAA